MEAGEIKELFEGHFLAIRAEMKAGFDLIDLKLNGVINRQDVANGKLIKNEGDIQKLKCNPLLKPIYKKPYPFMILGILFGVFFISGLIIIGVKYQFIFDFIKLIF